MYQYAHNTWLLHFLQFVLKSKAAQKPPINPYKNKLWKRKYNIFKLFSIFLQLFLFRAKVRFFSDIRKFSAVLGTFLWFFGLFYQFFTKKTPKMITFLANLLRNQSIYATKIIEYCSMLSDFFLIQKYARMRATKILKNILWCYIGSPVSLHSTYRG